MWFNKIVKCQIIQIKQQMLDMHFTKTRSLKLALKVLPIFFCAAANPSQAGYQNWSELSSWQYRSNATWGVHLHNYLLAESPERLFARRFTIAPRPPPFFFSFTPKLFFKASLVSLLLPRGLAPALFVRILSARRLLPPFSLPTRFSHRSVSICSLSLRCRLSSEHFESAVASKLLQTLLQT